VIGGPSRPAHACSRSQRYAESGHPWSRSTGLPPPWSPAGSKVVLTRNTSLPLSMLAYRAADPEPAGRDHSFVSAGNSVVRSTIPGRAMTSSGKASSDLISIRAASNRLPCHGPHARYQSLSLCYHLLTGNPCTGPKRPVSLISACQVTIGLFAVQSPGHSV
jgi:hypothetical protein